MLEALKIDVSTFNSLAVLHPGLFAKGPAAVNGMFLVREKGTQQPVSVFDKHEFHARFAWANKTYGGQGYQEVLVLPVDEVDTPLNPPLPGNMDPGFRRG